MKKQLFLILILLNIVYGYAQSVSYSSFEKWMPKPTAPYALKNTAYCESYHGGNTWVVFQVDSMQGSTVRGRHIWLMRMDMEGNNLWSKKLVCSNQDYVRNIISTPDDGILIGGQSLISSIYWGGWLCKINKDGNIQWAKRYQDNTPYTSTSIHHSIYKDGYYYAYGGRSKSITSCLFLTKTDTLGNIIWTKFYNDTTYSDQPSFETHHITSINDDIIITSSTAYLGFMLKLDTAGNIKFQRTYTSKYNDIYSYFRMKAVIPIKNNLLIFCNYSINPMFLIDSLGKVIWNNYSSPSQKVFHIPIMYKNNRVYCQTGRVSGVYDFSAGIIPSTVVNLYNENFPHFTVQNSISFTNSLMDKIIVIPDPSSLLTKVHIRKSDTTLITNCPQTLIQHKDTTILLRDTISNFYTENPTYTTTVLGGFRSEVLNLQWTFDCGKIAPSSVIHQNKPAINFVVYPNPAQEVVTIRTDLKNYEVRVWDSYGKLLHNISNIQQTDYTFPIQYLPQGMYHIECISNNQHYVQPFVKID